MHVFMKTTISLYLIVGAALSAFSQQFSIEKISPITKYTNEEAIDFNEEGLLLGRSGNSGKHLFVYDTKSKKLSDLSRAGLKEAFSINNKGIVVGTGKKKGQAIAAIWSKKNKLKLLGKLSSDDTFSFALDVNDRGEVVGYSGKTVTVSDNDGFPVEELRFHAFIYDDKNGLRKLFKDKAQNSAAIKINNKGQILAAINTDTDYPDDLYVRLSNRKGDISKIPGGDSLYVYGWGIRDYIKGLTISDSGLVGAFYSLYDLKNKTVKTLNEHNGSGRGDYGYTTHVNNKGEAVGYAGGAGWYYSPDRADTDITCLFPQNKSLDKKLPIQIHDLLIWDTAAIRDDGTIVFNGDLTGDGKVNQIFFVRKNASSNKGSIYSYCPSLQGAIVGECASYYTQYEGGIGQSAFISSGKQCTGKGFFSDNSGDTRGYGALRFQFLVDDFSSPIQYESCPTVVKQNVLIGVAGAAAQFNFNYSSKVDYSIVGPVNDERFRQSTFYFYSGAFRTDDDDPICYNKE